MSIVRIPIHGIEETIDRPNIIMITKDIKHYLGMDRDIHTVYDVNDQLDKKLSGGELKHNNTMNQEVIEVEYTEDIIEDHGRYLGYRDPRTFPIYTDKEINSYCKPLNHKRRMSINFKYSSTSKSGVNAVANKLRIRSTSEDFYIKHNLEYSYMVPLQAMELLVNISHLKNGKEFEVAEYINETFDSRVTVAMTYDGDHLKDNIAIREKQVDVLGFIEDDVSSIPKEYNEDDSRWSISFTYVIEYEKPVMLYFSYPLVIHNRLVDKKFREFLSTPNNRVVLNSPETQALYAALENTPNMNKSFNGRLLTYPPGDIVPTIETFGYNLVASILTLVDEQNPKTIFNIDDIPYFTFKPSARNYITTCKKLPDDFSNLFAVILIADGKKDYDNIVNIDSEGNLIASKPLDVRKTYRVFILVLNDMSLMLRNKKPALEKFIKDELADVKMGSVKVREANQAFEEYCYKIYFDKNLPLEDKFKLINDMLYIRNNLLLRNTSTLQNDYKQIMSFIKELDTTAVNINYLRAQVKFIITKVEDINIDSKTMLHELKQLSRLIDDDDNMNILNNLMLNIHISKQASIDAVNLYIKPLTKEFKELLNTSKDLKTYADLEALRIELLTEYNGKDIPHKEVLLTNINQYFYHMELNIIVSLLEDVINDTLKDDKRYSARLLLDGLHKHDLSTSVDDTIQDIYLELFHVHTDIIINTLKNNRDYEMIFKVPMQNNDMYFKSAAVVNLTKLFKDK